MHDELGEVAWKRGRRWLVVAVVLLAAGWAVAAAVVAGPVGAAVGFVVGLAAHGIWLPSTGSNRAGRPSAPVHPAPAQIAGLATGISLATGTLPTAVLRVESPAHDLGVLHGTGGWELLVTDGLAASHTLDEIEALGAAQVAALVDPRVRTLRAAADRLRVMLISPLAAGFVIPPAFLLHVTLGWMVMAWITAAALAGLLAGGRVRFWSRVAVDAAAVATTRHPQPLVSALVKVAAWNGAQLGFGPRGWVGLADRFWVRGGSPNWSSETTVNGRVTDKRTREQVDDVHLLIRAALVRRTCIEGADADLASYGEVRAAVRSAGKAAAKGRAATVEGMAVGLGGMVGPGGQPAAPPPPGSEPMLAAIDGLLDRLVEPRDWAAEATFTSTTVSTTGPVGAVTGTGSTTGPNAGAAPGWYRDPWQPAALLRWWDGAQWTPATTPAPHG